MKLSPELQKWYTTDRHTANEAQRMAQFISWGPIVFQTARLMVKFGILDLLRDAEAGLTRQEICQHTGLTDYAVKCLTEASLSIGLVLVDTDTDRFRLTKTGWFLLTDRSTRVNMEFNHDVNYKGWFSLEESLLQGCPVGLQEFGTWKTVYEGLSSLPQQVQDSWFGFDHYYSDSSFPEALQIVFDQHQVKTLYDVGGNTGKWALRCVAYRPDVRVTVLDLPPQIAMMQANIAGKPGCDRISGHAVDMLDSHASLPRYDGRLDAIWMSQFLDCFSMEQIVDILKKSREVMDEGTRVYIMETLWDRQRYETAAMCLTLTSLYFTAIANGNSKMYNTADLEQCIEAAGLTIETIHDHLGMGHAIVVCKKNQA